MASWQLRLVPAADQEGGQVPDAGQEGGQLPDAGQEGGRVPVAGQEGGQFPGAAKEVRERVPGQAVSLSLAGPRRKVVADLTALLAGRDCSNTSALYRYSVTIRWVLQ